ncbi:hypothetical protein MmiHf6_14670 [Methanimicrococcus hongohii]|uniref:ADP ribosyltransferase domain-containing protein n=1 Tax=Methanimicrococcus hongohii TaxID=3028295 RepID=A0AA96V338_9EURY|nr:ADP-ribosyltransferase [Methanimicrococcus sp. Hf6]WNY24138.1 hypothetical protein MmiHf6_14670 [Methanimicrococcus sp. Hf6]
MKEYTEQTFTQQIDTKNANIVAEKLDIFRQYSTFLIPYITRRNLTNAEKVCIGNYQDVHFWNFQRQRWSFPLPEKWEMKAWCYVINLCCRNHAFYNSLTEEEKEVIDDNIQNIDSAIRKSKTDKEYFVYRGVSDMNWLENPYEGMAYTEKAYGSFSLNVRNAYQYTSKEEPIIFQLNLKKGINALYLDKSEYEILLPRDTEYIIKKIERKYLKEFNKIIKIFIIEIKEE